MKFIRDIIGEKRQMEDSTNAEHVASQLSNPSIDPQPNCDATANHLDVPLHPHSEEDTRDELGVFGVEETQSIETAENNTQESLKDEQPKMVQPECLMRDAAPAAVNVALQDAAETDATSSDFDDLLASSDLETDPAHSADQCIENVFRGINKVSTNDTINEPLQTNNDPAEHAVSQMPETARSEPATATPQPTPVMQEHATVAPQVTPAMPESVEVPQPAVGRGASRHGRVKTRLLGFNPSMEKDVDPIEDNKQAAAAPFTQFPVGWLIVVEGEGRGSAFTLFSGVSNIGRGKDQTVCLDFGDNSISRDAHASIAFDPRQQSFYIGHSGKTNIVRRNDRPVLSTEEISTGDHITIGETTLRFVSLCGSDFSWEKRPISSQPFAANG